jgi:diguanylate cyclase (GGDEF)-like protein
MESGDRGPGGAFIVIADGRIGEILRLPQGSILASGVPFAAIMDGPSRSQAELFLEEVRRSGAAFGWELVSFLENSPTPYFFTGLRLEDRCLVLCGRHQEDLFRIFEEMTAVTDVHPGVWRAALRQLAETLARRSDARAAEVEELTRLNEELSELQRQLTRKNVELEALNAEVQRLAETDVLTGIWNRRGLFLRAERDFARARRYGETFGVIILDVDRFKDVNDRWGHQVGDQALTGLAAELKAAIRESDLLGRYGGEEFLLIATNGDEDQTTQLAERLRKTIEAARIPTAAGPLGLTVSAGVAAFDPGLGSLDELIARADHALLSAKSEGRNRIAVFPRPPAPPRP